MGVIHSGFIYTMGLPHEMIESFGYKYKISLDNIVFNTSVKLSFITQYPLRLLSIFLQAKQLVIHSGFIYTMGLPHEMIESFGYKYIFENNKSYLQLLNGISEYIISADCYQFNDYSKNPTES